MTKLEEMQNKLTALITTMREQLDSDQLDKAEATKNYIVDLKNKISQQIFLDELEAENFREKSKEIPANNQTRKDANFVRACIKKFSGNSVTEAEKNLLIENSLLLPTGPSSNGDNGEAYILPKDIQTTINRRIREYKSFRDIIGYYKTTAMSGSFPVEKIDDIVGLIDFSDGIDGNDTYSPKFEQVSFNLKEKAAFIKLSNTLLALTDNDLIAYIVEVFSKRAVITENTIAVTALKKGKTVTTLDGWKGLKSSINKDIDPGALYNTVIVTNQDGYDYLDNALDGNGRPILQPDPTQPTVKRFMGYKVEVFSNSMLPSSTATVEAAGYAPIFYGDLTNGAKFVDLGLTSFETSKDAGFMSHTTVARLIEYIDVIQCDNSDKCYIYGQVEVEAKKEE